MAYPYAMAGERPPLEGNEGFHASECVRDLKNRPFAALSMHYYSTVDMYCTNTNHFSHTLWYYHNIAPQTPENADGEMRPDVLLRLALERVTLPSGEGVFKWLVSRQAVQVVLLYLAAINMPF